MMRAFFCLVTIGTQAGCSEYDLKTTVSAGPGTGSSSETGEPAPQGDSGAITDSGGIIEPPPVDSGDPGGCEDFEPTPVPATAPNEECRREPAIGSFDPVIEWQWADNPIHPLYSQIMAAPAIANLTDDNGDGQVDESDIPDVVFTSFTGSAYSSSGAVTAIRGDSGETIWSVLNLSLIHISEPTRPY